MKSPTAAMQQPCVLNAPPSAIGNGGKDLVVGDTVFYKGNRAIVQYNGSATFGPGIWIGLEMLEGNDGTNDGASFVDKKRYFTCPKGKGVFVRASQVKKAGGV
jgi:dynactin complex subunit